MQEGGARVQVLAVAAQDERRDSPTESAASVSARPHLRPHPGTTDCILPSAPKFVTRDGVELGAGFTPPVTRRLYLERPTRHLAGGGFAGQDKRPSPRYL